MIKGIALNRNTGKEIVDPEIPTTMPQQEEPVSPEQQEHRDED